MKEDAERRIFGRRHTGAEWLILYGALAVLAFTAGIILFFGMMLRSRFLLTPLNNDSTPRRPTYNGGSNRGQTRI